MKDVVHPNSRGYEVLEKELAALLKKWMRGSAAETRREAGLTAVFFQWSFLIRINLGLKDRLVP